MTTTKGYDFLNRLTNTTTLDAGLGALDTHIYKYNTASQRTSVTNMDGSYWVYSYDSMGQVTSGKKYWSDNTPVVGQQFDYMFDDIGNRKTTTRDTRSATYTPNNLNQYTSRTVPGFMNVLGTATNTATVSLWSKESTALFTSTTRKGDYFRGEMPFNNATGALWLTITNVAVLSNSASADIVTNIAGSSLLAKTPEAFLYDADGNLTNDSLWAYTWDAENRLVKQESVNSLPTAGKRRLEFDYDHQSRRIQKLVSTNNGSTYVAQSTNRFIYDGWNLIATLNPQLSTINAFVWGLDLSGSEQGAGGVGGLLAVMDASTINNQPSTHFTAYDGNGNVSVLVAAARGTISAKYEYGPFSEGVRLTGPMAKANKFRFSTKYQDDENDQLYYGYRSYNPSNGRWLNRDSIGELGFTVVTTGQQVGFPENWDEDDDLSNRWHDALRAEPNLYVFVFNNALNAVDLLGLCDPKGKPVDIAVASDAEDLKPFYKDVPRVSNVAGIIQEMNKIKDCQCVRRLTIWAHGGKWGLTMGGNRQTSEKYTTNEITERNATAVFSKLKGKVCFCKPCEIYLLSCHTGKSKICKLIASATGCRVIAPKGLCWGNPNNPPKSESYEDLDKTEKAGWETCEP